MNARVSLLILVACIFVAVWDADRIASKSNGQPVAALRQSQHEQSYGLESMALATDPDIHTAHAPAPSIARTDSPTPILLTESQENHPESSTPSTHETSSSHNALPQSTTSEHGESIAAPGHSKTLQVNVHAGHAAIEARATIEETTTSETGGTQSHEDLNVAVHTNPAEATLSDNSTHHVESTDTSHTEQPTHVTTEIPAVVFDAPEEFQTTSESAILMLPHHMPVVATHETRITPSHGTSMEVIPLSTDDHHAQTSTELQVAVDEPMTELHEESAPSVNEQTDAQHSVADVSVTETPMLDDSTPIPVEFAEELIAQGMEDAHESSDVTSVVESASTVETADQPHNSEQPVDESMPSDSTIAGTLEEQPEADAANLNEEHHGESREETIPLPTNLAAGKWQVIRENGEMFHIAILRDEDSVTTPMTLEDQFCVRKSADGQRWCFVREIAEEKTATPDDAIQTPRPSRAATEFFSPIAR